MSAIEAAMKQRLLKTKEFMYAVVAVTLWACHSSGG
jgi:hypothetical protein